MATSPVARSRTLAGPRSATAGAEAEANVLIDFASPLPDSAITALSFGSCISTYSGDGQNVNIINGGTAADRWKATLADLGPLVWRIPLAWNGGRPGSGAGGARSYGDAAAYLRAIRDIGGTPMVAICGTTNDNDIRAADAAALVHLTNDNGAQNGGPVDHWIIGNEPDNGFGVDPYIDGGSGSSGFNAIAAAMRAATTRRLRIAGPTFVEYASYKEADFHRFLDSCGAQVDVVDFHKYGSGDGLAGNLALTFEYADAVRWLRDAVAARASTAGRVGVQVGELNYHPVYDPSTYGAPAFYTSRNTVHTASAIGHALNAGGAAYQYSDNNGPLGLITPGNDAHGAPAGRRQPTPAYYGLLMWTGGRLFRRATGAMATVTHDVPDLDVFASTAARNIIVVNKSASEARTVSLVSRPALSSGYLTWQTRPGLDAGDPDGPQWTAPRAVDSGALVGGRMTVTAPPMTVSCVLV